ncbi:MAG: tetratricopeptide repeat protein [Chitinophagales bacterium]|nr:tetratricopeptide repeat protein [Chitinophagales bacterium]
MGNKRKSGKSKGEKSKISPINPLHKTNSVTKKKSFFFFFALFLFSILLYSNTINHRYTFDDSIVITENEFTQKGFSGIPDLLSKDMFVGMYGEQLEVTGGRYRPLSLLTFAIEYELFGNKPMVGHLSNILLYGILTVLLFIAIQLISNNIYVALIATMLFASHPIHTEVVANIKSRDEILCLLLALSSMIFIIKFQASRSLFFIIIGLFCFYLSLLAKETAVSFLILTPAAVFIQSRKSLKQVILKTFFPLLAVFVIYFVIRASLVGMPGGSDSSDIMENPFFGSESMAKYSTIFHILGKYFMLMIFPHPLSSDYSFNQIPIRNWNIESIFWLVLYTSALLLSVIFIFRRNLIAFSILFYLVPLSITSNLFFNIGAPMGERFAFMSSVGFCLIIAILINRYALAGASVISNKLLIRTLIILAPIMLIYSWKTIDRNKDWYNNLSLFSSDIKTVPNSAKVHYYYGNTLQNRYLSGNKKEKEKIIEANKAFRKSVMINPKFHWALYNLGLTYKHLGNGDSAIFYLEKVLEINPTHIATQGVLGSIYGQYKQNYAKAIQYLEKSIEYGDLNKSNFHNLAIAYALSGNYGSAELNFKKAIQYAPNDARLNYELGITLQNLDKQEEAQKYLEKAAKLDQNLAK